MSEYISADEKTIEAELENLPSWKREGSIITRDIVCADFASAVGAVNAVAVLAEAMDHHPDILVFGWNKLKITLTTHSKGGLTNKDFELAGKIDNLRF